MNCDHNSETCLKCVIEKAMEKQTTQIVQAMEKVSREDRQKLKIIGIELSRNKEKRGFIKDFIHFFTGVR